MVRREETRRERAVVTLPHLAWPQRDLRWLFGIHHLCVICLYIIFLLCLFLNMYALLAREDTQFHLRTYHATVGVLMLCCSVVECEFLYRTRLLPKLAEPHDIPMPALAGAIALTIGISLGYLYFIVFSYAFLDCDKLVDTVFDSADLWLEAIYDVIMALFSILSLLYLLQRRYYGAINSNLDKIGRLFINLTFTVVWIKVVLFKGFTSHQELCQRKELEGYWCPVMKRRYECSPSNDLHGTQKMWYYINKGLLSSAVISCASEFFPVLLVTHWLACGGAEERAEDIKRRQQRRQGLEGLMREFMKDVTRVFVPPEHATVIPEIQPRSWLRTLLWFLTPAAMLVGVARWLCFFYYAMDFDDLVHDDWEASDIMALISALMNVSLFGLLYFFAYSVDNQRLDAHHKAHARGDIGILFGCAAVLAVKFVLQSIETAYQKVDGFIVTGDAVMRIIVLALVQTSQWLQYLGLRRILAISTRDLFVCKSFLPLAAVGGLLLAWVHFGCTYLDTTLIKYQLTDETYRFSSTTLICMIFTQTMFPAEYLFAFTASGCYLELLGRYLMYGFFQLSPPRLHVLRHHSVSPADLHKVHGKNDKRRFEAGENLATMIEAGRKMERKRAGSTSESNPTESSSAECFRPLPMDSTEDGFREESPFQDFPPSHSFSPQHTN